MVGLKIPLKQLDPDCDPDQHQIQIVGCYGDVPKKFTRICWQLLELSAKYAEFFFKIFLDLNLDPDDFQYLIVTSCPKILFW